MRGGRNERLKKEGRNERRRNERRKGARQGIGRVRDESVCA